jgi:VWFA-related protein
VAVRSLAAAPAASPSAAPLFESVDVTVASLEVFVTDGSGQPVSGLAAADFEVFEGKKRMEITHFSAGEGPAAPASPAPTSPTTPTSSGTPGTPRTLEAGGGPRNTFAVFLDNRDLEPASHRRAIERLTGLLQGLPPDERFVLVTYDPAFAIRSFAAGDREGIAAALARGTPGGVETRAEVDSILLGTEVTSTEHWVEKRLAEIKAVFRALGQAVDALAGLPGHKVLLIVTGELPSQPGVAAYGYVSGSRFDATSDLENVVARANAGHVTLYGLGIPAGGRTGGNHVSANRLDALATLAEGSGGQFVVDPADPGALASRALVDVGTFYSLGYTPPPGKAEQTRQVSIRVKKPGLTVRYRKTYEMRSGADVTLDRIHTALALGEASNPLGIAAEWGEVTPADKGNLAVEVKVRFPLGRLALLPNGAAYEGKLLVLVGARNERGELSGLAPIPIPLSIPEARMAEASKQYGTYVARLVLRPEPCQVVIGLRDEIGNGDSTLVLPWRPPTAPAGRK